MLDNRNRDTFINILRDVFERRALLDHSSLASYCIKVAAFMCKVQHYYTMEKQAAKGLMLSEVNELIRLKPPDFIEDDIFNYLLEIKQDIELKLNEEVEAGANDSWLNEIISKEIVEIPGMLYPDMMKYYQWLGKNMPEEGSLVELGCWLGQSTYCLAEGLMKSNSNKKKIHVFDSFKWDKWMNAFMEPEKLPDINQGDSFLDIFRWNCQRFMDIISINEVDILHTKSNLWNNGPIAVLIYDISHEEYLIEATWRRFKSSFIPGKTIIVFNQYGNLRSESIRRFCRLKSDQLNPVHKINGSAKSFLFKE